MPILACGGGWETGEIGGVDCIGGYPSCGPAVPDFDFSGKRRASIDLGRMTSARRFSWRET